MNTEQPKKNPDRQPIPIEEIVAVTPQGFRVPRAGGKLEHTFTAGVHGLHRIDIEYRPWMRQFRVVKSAKAADDKGREIWVPQKPFYVHETLVTWVPVEDV